MANRDASTPASVAWRYSTPAIVLHWLLAALVIFMVALGWSMTAAEDAHDPNAEQWFDLHKSIGLIVAVLVLLRIVWRLTHKPEPLPTTMPAWQVRLAGLTQALLYLGMAVMVVTGSIGAAFQRNGLDFFGWAVAHPKPNRPLQHLLFEIHETAVWILVALVALHVAGALKHLVLDKDGTFKRMWFGRGSP